MSLLAVKSLSLTLAIPLFGDLSFTLSPGDRLGLIAANGRGKSSLLRCLAGQIEPRIEFPPERRPSLETSSWLSK